MNCNNEKHDMFGPTFCFTDLQRRPGVFLNFSLRSDMKN